MKEKTQNAISDQRSAFSLRDEQGWKNEFADWLEEERSPKTVSAYRQDLKAFCDWFERINGQAFTPDQMNSADARAWREYTLEVEHLAPATWNRRHNSLKMLCRWIEERLDLRLFPFEKRIKRAPEQEQAPRWLTQAEERAVMRRLEINITAAATKLRRWRAIRDRALVAVMRYAGLRVEEAAMLELGDVQLAERKGSVTVRRGKRDKTRTVPLSSSAREALGEWLEVRQSLITLPSGSAKFTTSFFTAEDGGGLSTRAIQKRIAELARQTGIADLTCHALRHTCAKSMLDAGRPLSEVQKILGHEKLETTARYVQPGREDLQEAVEAGELGRMGKGK